MVLVLTMNDLISIVKEITWIRGVAMCKAIISCSL